jgi:hypothetical protein
MIRHIASVLALLWTAPVVTEKVDVGERRAIDLAPFACTDTPRSSLVQRVCYDEARRYLLVNVRGSLRDYCGLSATTFNAFVAAPSMGQFYAQNIAASGDDGPFKCPVPSPQTKKSGIDAMRNEAS